MIILGIDPGSRKTGFGVIEVCGKKIRHIDSGVLHFDKAGVFLDRLGLIFNSCRELVKTYRPDEVALESLIFVKNVNSLAKLSQARGAMIAAFHSTHYQKIFEYPPNLVKNAVTGHGHATKESVIKSMQMYFGNQIEFTTHDESDALAIALTHSLLGGDTNMVKGKAKYSRGRSLKSAFRHLE